MRLLVLAAALILLPAASAADRSGTYSTARDAMRADCPAPPGKQHALDPNKPLKAQKLGELPPAEAYQAVLRTDRMGCLDPLLVKDRLRQQR